jgi:hypothetical protein
MNPKPQKPARLLIFVPARPMLSIATGLMISSSELYRLRGVSRAGAGKRSSAFSIFTAGATILNPLTVCQELPRKRVFEASLNFIF